MPTPSLSWFPGYAGPRGQLLGQQVNRSRSCRRSRKAGAREPRGEDGRPPSLCSTPRPSEAPRGALGPHPAGRGRSVRVKRLVLGRRALIPHFRCSLLEAQPRAGPLHAQRGRRGWDVLVAAEARGGQTGADLPAAFPGQGGPAPSARRAEQSGEASPGEAAPRATRKLSPASRLILGARGRPGTLARPPPRPPPRRGAQGPQAPARAGAGAGGCISGWCRGPAGGGGGAGTGRGRRGARTWRTRREATRTKVDRPPASAGPLCHPRSCCEEETGPRKLPRGARKISPTSGLSSASGRRDADTGARLTPTPLGAPVHQ